MRGFFLTFEGPEGSGKSTHIKLLAEWLRIRGIKAIHTREPGGTPLGEAIRSLLQYNGSGEAPVPRAEVLLFLASRAQHVERLIKPALQEGTWVLCDRFSDSTLAYQGFGRGFPLEDLKVVDNFATDKIKPDLTFLLDVSLAESRARLTMRQKRGTATPDRIEAEPQAFHARMRNGFLELARSSPERFVVLSTERAREEVAAEIQSKVERELLRGGHQ